MEIREIFDTIESDPNMDEELQQDILKKIENIANADKIVDGLEEKIEQHKSELSEKELKYIINKCIAYKSVFYRFRNGKIVEYDQLNEITNRIFQLEDSIRNNDFSVWKEELLAYKGSKEDREEDKMLKNMLMVVPEETNVVEKVTRMFKRAFWKIKQKSQKHKEESEEVIELPQNTFVDLASEDEAINPDYNKEAEKTTEEVDEEALEDKFGDDFLEEDTEEVVETVEDTDVEMTRKEFDNTSFETTEEDEELTPENTEIENIEEQEVPQEVVEEIEEVKDFQEEDEQPKRRRAATMKEVKETQETQEAEDEAPKKRVRKAVQKNK